MNPLVTTLIVLTVASLGAASIFTDVLGMDCRTENAHCDIISHCCDELQCYYEKGLTVMRRRAGTCVKCVGEGLNCHRDEQCCGNDSGSLCQKVHPAHVNGVCNSRLRKDKVCYKNSQCNSGICEKPNWWFMYGKCVPDD